MASAAEEARFAYRQLRERERIVRQAAAVRLQAAARGLLARQLREYRQQLRDRDRINARLGEAARSGGCAAVVHLQAAVRSFLARRRLQEMRRRACILHQGQQRAAA
jgi:hypothetical protein